MPPGSIRAALHDKIHAHKTPISIHASGSIMAPSVCACGSGSMQLHVCVCGSGVAQALCSFLCVCACVCVRLKLLTASCVCMRMMCLRGSTQTMPLAQERTHDAESLNALTIESPDYVGLYVSLPESAPEPWPEPVSEALPWMLPWCWTSKCRYTHLPSSSPQSRQALLRRSWPRAMCPCPRPP